ncbi:hypothetical protein [uncultured Sphingomonas sp.]|uniref:hypothetical protein n=1 Tax=uncultured Sphingomonas sp. TaxID=158754 RepID=UPI0025D895B7|nr:hypothetical protein [uncultured Sphingomonas sp.]
MMTAPWTITPKSPLAFGLRITILVRDTSEQARADAVAKVDQMAAEASRVDERRRTPAAGQQRPLDLHARGEVTGDTLYTAPGRSDRGANDVAGRSGCRSR